MVFMLLVFEFNIIDDIRKN